jgi:hypothetical protein
MTRIRVHQLPCFGVHGDAMAIQLNNEHTHDLGQKVGYQEAAVPFLLGQVHVANSMHKPELNNFTQSREVFTRREPQAQIGLVQFLQTHTKQLETI